MIFLFINLELGTTIDKVKVMNVTITVAKLSHRIVPIKLKEKQLKSIKINRQTFNKKRKKKKEKMHFMLIILYILKYLCFFT